VRRCRRRPGLADPRPRLRCSRLVRGGPLSELRLPLPKAAGGRRPPRGVLPRPLPAPPGALAARAAQGQAASRPRRALGAGERARLSRSRPGRDRRPDAAPRAVATAPYPLGLSALDGAGALSRRGLRVGRDARRGPRAGLAHRRHRGRRGRRRARPPLRRRAARGRRLRRALRAGPLRRGERLPRARARARSGGPPAPDARLARARRSPHRGGAQCGGLGAALFGRAWSGLELPRHLSHFTPASLEQAVERAGGRVVWRRQQAKPRHYLWSLRIWLRDRGAERLARLTEWRPAYGALKLGLELALPLVARAGRGEAGRPRGGAAVRPGSGGGCRRRWGRSRRACSVPRYAA
jgi:hypothetical protein